MSIKNGIIEFFGLYLISKLFSYYSPNHLPPILVRWFPPPLGAFKLNFDGSRKSNSASAGIIIRDSNGNVITDATFNLGTTQVYMAEAMALHKGVLEASKLNIKNLHIEGDNLLVINTIKGIWKTPWNLQYIIEDIKNMLRDFD